MNQPNKNDTMAYPKKVYPKSCYESPVKNVIYDQKKMVERY